MDADEKGSLNVRTPGGKPELAGAIADLLAQIEREQLAAAGPVTYDTWVARPLPYQGSTLPPSYNNIGYEIRRLPG